MLGCQGLSEIYTATLVNEISNFSYFYSAISFYVQIILCLQNTTGSSSSKITWVSSKLLPFYHNTEDKQELKGVQQLSVICNTETSCEVRFKIAVYLHTVLKK